MFKDIPAGSTALQICLQKGFTECVELLIDQESQASQLSN